MKPNKKHPANIIVSCPNWVGDVVMATPTFDCVRQNFPDARIIALVRSYARGVVEDGPWFDRIIECRDKNISGFIGLIRTIRRLKPDMTIVLPNSFRSALIARLGGARQICGYRREGRSMMLSGGPEPERGQDGILPVPMKEYYLEICRWLQLKIPNSTSPRLYYSDALRAKADNLLTKWGIRSNDMVIGLNPGAKFGSSKCWPPHYFASLAEMLTEQQRVDLTLLKPLIKRCQLLVTNDTGPRHYAVAFGVPVVVIMGPTDPRYTDTNLEKTLVLRQSIDCSPCHEKICPREHACMAEITPHEVLGSTKKLLKEFV